MILNDLVCYYSEYGSNIGDQPNTSNFDCSPFSGIHSVE